MSASDHERIRILQRWDVCRHRMPSGLRILMLEDHSTPLISYHTWFGVGSRHEKEGKTGLAHLFEHLMFESTMRHPSGELRQGDGALRRRDERRHVARLDLLPRDLPPEALELVLDFEPDRMTNVILDEKVVEREKSVVMNERKYRVDDRVEGVMEEVMYRAAFKAHPYRNPTIGWMEDIRSFTLEDCTRFYRTYYSPGNAVVVVSGSFRHDEMIRVLGEKYAAIPPQEIPHESPAEEPPRRSSGASPWPGRFRPPRSRSATARRSWTTATTRRSRS